MTRKANNSFDKEIKSEIKNANPNNIKVAQKAIFNVIIKHLFNDMDKSIDIAHYRAGNKVMTYPKIRQAYVQKANNDFSVLLILTHNQNTEDDFDFIKQIMDWYHDRLSSLKHAIMKSYKFNQKKFNQKSTSK